MITIINLNLDQILGIRIDGKIEAGEIEPIFNLLEDKFAASEKIRVYVEVRNIEEGYISKEALKEEFKLWFRNPGIVCKVEKGVLLTDVNWLKMAFDIECAVIPTLEGKSFSFGQEEEALKWLTTDHRAKDQIDIIFPELVEFGTVKAVGGFALGLLAANYLSKGQRRTVGLAALAGSFVLGIPLAIKVLNNNRKLLG